VFRMQSAIPILAIGGLLGLPSLLLAQLGQSSAAHESLIFGDDIVVVVANSRQVVSAFSVDTGTWGSIELNIPLDPKSGVVVSGKLAVFETEDSIYAFNAKRAIWDQLSIPKDAVASVASYNNRIQVRKAGSLFLYSANSLKWSGKILATGQDSPVESPSQIK
jgi:hypothetical protein